MESKIAILAHGVGRVHLLPDVGLVFLGQMVDHIADLVHLPLDESGLSGGVVDG